MKRGEKMDMLFLWLGSEQATLLLAFVMMLFLVFAVVLSLLLLHKINHMKRRLDQITGIVENYISAILEEEQEETVNADAGQKKTEQITTDEQRFEEQNRLISSVLQEIFS